MAETAETNRSPSQWLPHRGGRSVVAATGAATVVELSAVPTTRPRSPDDVGCFHQQGQTSQPLSPVPIAGETPPPAPDRRHRPLAWPASPTGDNGALAVGDQVVSFAGLSSSSNPPDTILAVGPGHVLEAVNKGFGIWTKGGSEVQPYTEFAAFFDSLEPDGWQGTYFDPRVVFSAPHQQFLMLILGKDAINRTSYFFLAVSHSSDPTGAWWTWRVARTWGNADDIDAWLDYASLGVDNWGIYVVGNLYTWQDAFKYAKLFCLSPAMLSGGAIGGSVFWDLRWPDPEPNEEELAMSLQVAHPHSSTTGGETYLVNTYPVSGNKILLWTLCGDRTSAPALSRAAITTLQYNAIGPNVAQPGVPESLDGGSASVLNAVYSQRRVYATLTTDTWNSGLSSDYFVVKLDVDSNSNEWNVLGPSSVYDYYFYPAITVAGGSDTDPLLAVYMNWTSIDVPTFASGVVKIFTDHPNSDDGPLISVVCGLGPFRPSIPGGNRWGDYSGAVFDWYTGHVWGAVEYAGDDDWWRTHIEARVFAEAGDMPVFGDGFESEDTSSWSAVAP